MRWSLVGASTIAAEHMIRAVQAHPGALVAWVVSNDAGRGRTCAEAHGIPRATTQLPDMLADLEVKAVYISTTNERHHAQAVAAVATGKAGLCEKSLGLTLDEAVGMVRAAEAARSGARVRMSYGGF